MADNPPPAPTPGEGDGVDAFFARCGLPPAARLDCRALARRLFPGADVADAEPQGYCSYTLCVGRDRVLQFRPPAHRLDPALADEARRVYGALAPRTRLLDVPPETDLDPDPDPDPDRRRGAGALDVVLMARVPGVSLARLRAAAPPHEEPPASPRRRRQRASVVAEFAALVATGWAHRRPGPAAPRGRVGGSLRWRLEELGARLPRRLRPAAGRVLRRLDDVVALPWVLTHGDVVPANVMVRPAAPGAGAGTGGPGRVVVTGLLDWAEAEYLPFGVGLYGLECLLGEADGDGGFSYYPDEEELRALFWARLEAALPGAGLGPGTALGEVVEVAHALGVLLWHGFAFDDGRLDRVVEEGRDDAEVRRLDLFFAGGGDETEGEEDTVPPATAHLARRLDLRQAILGM